MARVCLRCGRRHSGVCGIPGIGVRIGIGGQPLIGRLQVRRARESGFTGHIVPRYSKPRLTKGGLEELLAWGLEQEKKCREMLNALSPGMAEYEQLLERLDKVIATNEQIRKQLAERKLF